MEGAVDPTWGEAFEVAPLSDEEDVPDPYTDEQGDAAFYDPLSEAALVRAPPIALVIDIFRRGLACNANQRTHCVPQRQYVGVDDLESVRTLEMRVDVSEASASLIGPLRRALWLICVKLFD